MVHFLASFFLLSGIIFVLLAAVGLYKMHSFYTRMQVASKASALGILCVLISVCLYLPTLETFLKSSLIGLFLLLTTPIATHALAQVAQKQNTKKNHDTSEPAQ